MPTGHPARPLRQRGVRQQRRSRADPYRQAAGGLAGALLVSRFVTGRQLPRLLGWGALACGTLLLTLLGYPLVHDGLWPALVLVAVAGLPFAVVATAQTTLL